MILKTVSNNLEIYLVLIGVEDSKGKFHKLNYPSQRKENS